MRTTIELPDDVLLRAKEQAAKQGMDVNQFIAVAITKHVGLASDHKPASALATAAQSVADNLGWGVRLPT